MGRTLRSLGLVMSESFRADPARATGTLLATLAESGTVVLLPFWIKLIADAAIAGDTRRVAIAAAAYGGTLALLGVTNMARNRWSAILVERTGHHIDRRLVDLSMRITSLAHHERPDWANEMNLLREQRWRLSGSVYATVNNLRALSALAGSVLLLASIDTTLLLLPLFGIPMMIAGSVTTAMEERVREANVERTRTSDHLFKLATEADPGKEIRIFGLRDELLRRFEMLGRVWDRESRRVGMKASAIWLGSWMVFAVGYVLALVFVTVGAIDRPDDITPGDVLMAFTIAGELSSRLGGVAGGVIWLRQSLVTVGRFLWLIDIERDERPRAATASVPERLERGIELHGVSFRYPGTDADVLTDVDIAIPAGSTVALVGDNGAGKTTLIKLLCRFYEPTTGTITVDGIDLADLDVESWREATAGGFQDFVQFELLARETVGVGKLADIADAAAIEGALERAHASDVAPTLPSGLETQLGRSFEDGVELSQGQWQKLALGRAMMREAPLLLLLDEPTASLDAETEHALFERYAQAASRVGRTNGAVTVLVSHRFSTVRMADLIVVIEGGRVVEQGTHADLLARGGVYAELFTLQARAYS